MTRLHVFFIGALALTACAVAQAAPNVLLNPGFEIDAVLNQEPVPIFTDWATGNAGTFNTSSAPLNPVHSGNGALQIVANGGFAVPLVLQTFPASPGQRWDLQGFLMTPTALATANTRALLKIVFGGGGDLEPASIILGVPDAQPFPGIIPAVQLDNTATPNVWTPMHISGIAPEGTTTVSLFGIFVDETPGTVYFDDLQGFLAGDFDADLDVDGADLAVWQGAYSTTSGGDADGDGDSDGNDFLIWQQELAPPPPVGVAAPEPSSVLLIVSGLALVGRRRLKRLAR